MRLFFALPLLAASSLAACNDGGSVTAENESAESVARKVAASDLKPRPGRWESTMKIESLEAEGMPPEARQMMQRMGEQTFATCLTPEEAAKPDAEFFGGRESGCTYETFAMGGGRIDAVMSCNDKGQTQKMKMNGTYGPEAYTMKVSSEGEMQPGVPMTMAMTIASRRVGDCTGKDEL